MDQIVISPPIFNFDNTLLTNRPTSIDFSIKNNAFTPIKIDFTKASLEGKYWFTSLDDTIKKQRKLGFDLFFSVKKLSSFYLDKNKNAEVSFVLIPNQCTNNFPESISLPVRYIQDINTFRESDPFFIDIPIKSKFSEISFKVSPRNLFLNDCCKNQIQTKTFQIKNRCPHKLPIMIFPPENISITTPELKNYVEVNPNESISLTLTHKPTEIGQFNYRILFDCILASNIEPREMKLMTSVSPIDIPPDFPVITPENSQIDFGEIHTGAKVCKSFIINNPGDHLYDVSVASVFDIFLNNSTQSAASLPSQVTFRNASSSVYQNKLSIKLHPHSGITIFVEYQPSFHQKADTTSLEHRTFMLSLSFSDNKTHSTYYRRIKCKSAVCHSMISVTPTTIDFGDTIVGRFDKTFSIKVENQSPLDTTVRLFPSSRSLIIPPGPLVVPGRSHKKFVVTFYPKKINPDFNSTIIITNENNPSNEIHITISAIVIPGESESLHAMCYTLYSNVSHLSSLNLNNCASNYPIVKSFYIKNRTNKFLNLQLSSTTDEMSFFVEKNSSSTDSGSQTNFIYLSSSNEYNLPQQQVQQSGNSFTSSSSTTSATISATSLTEPFTLLTKSSTITSLKQCETIMKVNSDFFTNQFTLLDKNSEIAVVEHFDTLRRSFQSLIENEEYATNISKIPLEIPPQCRSEVFIVLIPHGNSLLWKHRVEKMSIELINPPIKEIKQKQQQQQQQLPLKSDSNQEISKNSSQNVTNSEGPNMNSNDNIESSGDLSITEKIKPLEIPIIFNEATSASFLSSHSLFFGTIQRNNVFQKKIYLNNESSLPLLFNFESEAVIFKKKKTGIILPFDSLSAPFSMCPKIDGEMHEKISVQNVLNPEEKQEIKLKGTVVRRSNFIVDPITLDFGVISTGQSSHKLLVFVTNTSSDSNELTLLHNQKESGHLKPLITFQLKNSNSKRLTESMRMQIEKLEQKLRILKRKKKSAYAEQVQHLLDNLTSKQKETNTSPQIKHMMNTKYMDHFSFNAAPFQIFGVELQLITIMKNGDRSGQINSEIEGSILVYEKGRSESQKIIHYKARVNPQEQRLLQQISENSSKNNQNNQNQSQEIVIEPNSFNLKHLHVQECESIEMTITNMSNIVQNYWISSDSTRDCIISSPKNEGSIEPNETHVIRVDIFCTAPGEMQKSITLTTKNSMQVVPFQIQSEFQRLLTFSGVNLVPLFERDENDNNLDDERSQKLKIDFGNFPLTSLQVVEKRSSFTICNTTVKPLYVKIINDDEDDVLLYEQDPKEPLNLPFLIDAKATVIINVLMKSEIDTITYIKYRTKIVDAKLTIKTFATMEEANDSSSCLSKDCIQVMAKVGRVGLRLSEKVVDLGKVKKGECEASLNVKNKSTHIPIDVLTTTSQGLTVDQSIFHITGKKVFHTSATSSSSSIITPSSSNVSNSEKIDGNDKKLNTSCIKKINFKFTPSSNGINEAKLQFTINGIPSYSKAATVIAFVDPDILKTDLPLNDKQIDFLDIGEIYVNDNKPVPKKATINLTNISNYSQTAEFCNKRYIIDSKSTQKVIFDFPFPDYVYNPEDPKFKYRITIRSITTRTVLKIIDVVGEFSVSIGTLSHDNVSLGQFGQFNNFKYDEKHLSVTNKSNIPLIIKPSCKPPLLIMPTEMIPPISPNEKFKFNLVPDIEKLKKENIEGSQTVIVNFINQNNLKNQMRATITFDILSSILQFGRIEKENGCMKLIMTKFAPVVVLPNEEENDNIDSSDTFIANSWFTVTNHQNHEISVQMEVELLAPDMLSIELFLRKSEIKITQFDLQPNESSEIRVKATMKKSKCFDKKLECSLAKVTFNPDLNAPVSLLIVYRPEESYY